MLLQELFVPAGPWAVISAAMLRRRLAGTEWMGFRVKQWGSERSRGWAGNSRKPH